MITALGAFGVMTMIGSAFGLVIAISISVAVLRAEGPRAAAKDFVLPGGAALYGLIVGFICLTQRVHWKLILLALGSIGTIGIAVAVVRLWPELRSPS